MTRVSIRDLRNKGGEIVDRSLRGESITITRLGEPVAELGPVRGRPLKATELLRRWQDLPTVDPDRLRSDIDKLIDSEL